MAGAPFIPFPLPSVRKPFRGLPPRRPVAQEKSPLVPCPGCGRPARPICRGCEAKAATR